MNVVVTSLFTKHPDPQSGRYWDADLSSLTVLESVHRHGWHAVVINDCLDEPDASDTTFVRVDNDIPNAYWARWKHIDDWLSRSCFTGPSDVDLVWCVDATDVVMLNDPAPHMDPHKLYIGSEPMTGPNARTVGFWWMRHLHPDHAEWIDQHADDQLLNCGIVGGLAEMVSVFAGVVTRAHRWFPNDKTDMATVNEFMRDHWTVSDYVTGHPVHSSMWDFATSDPEAWFAHK